MVEPVETTRMVEPVETTRMVEPVDTTRMVEPVETTSPVPGGHSDGQLPRFQRRKASFGGRCPSQWPRPGWSSPSRPPTPSQAATRTGSSPGFSGGRHSFGGRCPSEWPPYRGGRARRDHCREHGDLDKLDHPGLARSP